MKYQLINGTSYHAETPHAVIIALEYARKNNSRVRIFYGDTKTGRSWNDEHYIIGRIGRSTGPEKIPLLIYNARSIGGTAILDYCIIRIQSTKGNILYQHPTFTVGELTTGYLSTTGETAVYSAGSIIASFPTPEKAYRYISFLKGERNHA